MTEDDLLVRIRAARDDDSPRLNYADWLLERGDWRGELIKVQCLIAKRAWPYRQPRHGGPSMKELRAREAELLARLKEMRPDWAAQWPPFCTRGFADEVIVCDLPTFLREEVTIRRAHPLAAIRLTDDFTITGSVQKGSCHAVMLEKREGGASIAGGSFEETATVKVYREGREIYTESCTRDESYSHGYGHTHGEVFTSIALSHDGQVLTMKTSAGRELIRSLTAGSDLAMAPVERPSQCARLVDELEAVSDKRQVLRAVVKHMNEQDGPLPEALKSAVLGSLDAIRRDATPEALGALVRELRGECKAATAAAAFFDDVVKAHDRLENAAYGGIISAIARSYPKEGSQGRCPKCKSKKVCRSPVGIEFTKLDCGDCGESDVVDVWGLAEWGDED